VRHELQRCVADLFRHQHGIVSRSQVLALGLTRHQIQHLVERGVWIRMAPGVYRHRAVADTWSARVLAACLSTGGVASHRSAAVLWGLDLIDRGRPEITIARGRHLHRSDAVVHESTQFDRIDRTVRRAVPVTGIERTLLDLAAVVGDTLVLAAVDSARRQGLTSWEAMDRTLGRHARRGRGGTRRFRRTLERLTGEPTATLSGWSWQVSQLLQASHLPAPSREYVVRDPSGAFVAQVDLAYPLIRLAIELDSVAHHDNARSFVADRRRWNRLTTLGWTPLAFTYRDFTERPAELVQRVTEVYLRLERRSPPLRR
jgi:hypothetical protein